MPLRSHPGRADTPIQPARDWGFLLAAAGGALAVLALYWPARENGFVWDDFIVLDFERTAGLRDPALWRETLLRPPADLARLFRPITMWSFLLQLWAEQSEPAPFHIVNVAIHAANVFLVTLVSWRLLDDGAPDTWIRPALAAWCGLIFGIHPTLTEPVIWISARSDLLLIFFLSFALLLDRSLPETGWRRALAVGAVFFAAALSKETAIGFLLALPLVHLAVDRSRSGPFRPDGLGGTLARHIKVYAVLMGTSVIYLAARWAVSGESLGLATMTSRIGELDAGQHALVVVASLAHHVWSAFWPFQNMVPGEYWLLPVDAMLVLPMVAASAGVFGVAVLAVRAGGAGRAPALLFLAFIASLLPVANIVPLPIIGPDDVGVASRYRAFPLVFACLAAPFVIRLAQAQLAQRFRYGPVLLWAVVGAWMFAAAANVRVTIPLWKNDGILNYWAIRHGPPSSWRQVNLGNYYVRIGDLGRARDAFTTAVGLSGGYSAAWYWLGAVEADLGNVAQAMMAFRRTLEISPDKVEARVGLARLWRATGDPKRAAQTLEEGLERSRESGRPHQLEGLLRYELGLAYAELGRPDDAIAQLSAAVTRARGPDERRAIEEALKSIARRQ